MAEQSIQTHDAPQTKVEDHPTLSHASAVSVDVSRDTHAIRAESAQPTTTLPMLSKPVLGTKTVERNAKSCQSTSNSSLEAEDNHVLPVYWPTFLLLVGFTISGIVFALAHHFYYHSLDSQPTWNSGSQWPVRIGTGFALLTQASLVAAATIAYRQYYWTILRGKSLSISSIDSIMGALTDLWALTNLEMIRHVPFVTVIAVLIWCLPLAAVTPPATLTVVEMLVQPPHFDQAVPLIDWSTVPGSSSVGGIWQDTTSDLYRLTVNAAYARYVQPMTGLYVNYSYPLTFYGPRFKCGGVAQNDQKAFNQMFGPADVWSQTMPANSSLEFWAYNATDLFSADALNFYGMSNQHRFDFWARMQTNNITCQTWNVSYQVDIRFVNSVQNITITNLTYLERVVPADPYSITPGTIFGYASWFKAFTALFKGSVSDVRLGSIYYQKVTTSILQTSLAACRDLGWVEAVAGGSWHSIDHRGWDDNCPDDSLGGGLEQLSEMVTLSYFSYDKKRGNTTVPVTLSTNIPVYHYDSRPLVASYTIVIVTTLVLALIGHLAMDSNGVAYNSSFSAIVYSTRNPDLDRLARSRCSAASPLGRGSTGPKIRFGVLRDTSGQQSGSQHGHGNIGFGLAESTSIIKDRRKRL